MTLNVFHSSTDMSDSDIQLMFLIDVLESTVSNGIFDLYVLSDSWQSTVNTRG
jgi:hypothetical protein